MSETPMTDAATRQVIAQVKAMGLVLRRWVSETAPPLIAMFKTLAKDPVIRKMIAAAERGELTIEPYRPCHCFCGASHPGTYVCDGDAVAVVTRWSDRFGSVDIAVCSPCHDAQMSAVGR